MRSPGFRSWALGATASGLEGVTGAPAQPLVRDRQQPPFSGDALELVSAAVGELEARPDH